MPGYYTERLAAERLRACYDLAPPRTKAYLEAEVEFVLAKTTPSMLALELGCGYGRVLERLLPRVRVAFGIDTSPSSLCMALEYLGRKPSLCLACMDSVEMGFRDRAFDHLHSEWHLCLCSRAAAAIPRGDSGDPIRRAGDVFELHSSILGASTGMV